MKIERRKDHTAQEHIFRVYPFADSEALLINNGQASHIEAIRNLRTGDVRVQVNIQMTGDWRSADLDKIAIAINKCQQWAEYGDYPPRPTHWDKSLRWNYSVYECTVMDGIVHSYPFDYEQYGEIESTRKVIKDELVSAFDEGLSLDPARRHWWIEAEYDDDEGYECIVVEVAFWETEKQQLVFMPLVPEVPTVVFQPELVVGERVQAKLFARWKTGTLVDINQDAHYPYAVKFDDFSETGKYRADELRREGNDGNL